MQVSERNDWNVEIILMEIPLRRHKILPQLITAYEYGDAGSAILPPMFKVSLKRSCFCLKKNMIFQCAQTFS